MRTTKILTLAIALAFTAAACGKKKEEGGAAQGQKQTRPAGKVDCKKWCEKAKACKDEMVAVFLKGIPEQARAQAKASMEKNFTDTARCEQQCSQTNGKEDEKLTQSMLACYNDDCKAMAECVGKVIEKAKKEAQAKAAEAAKKAQQAAQQAAQKAGEAAQKAGEAAQKAGEAAQKAGAEAAKKAGEAAQKAGAEAAKKAGEAAKKAAGTK